MSEDHFRIVFEGPAVDDGEMEIGQLAPSLLALGRLLEAVDLAVNGEAGRVRVKVKADTRRGSFDVGIALDFLHSVKEWLLSPEGTAVTDIVSITGIGVLPGTIGLIQLVRWLSGRHIAAKIVLKDGNVRIETNDGTSITVIAPVSRIIDDPVIRQHLERVTEPLRSDGVDAIRFRTAEHRAEIISADEAPAFEAIVNGDPTSRASFEATYQIKRLYFERGRKWRLSNGAQTILAEIEDEAFWSRVERSEESFAADDYLRCIVRMDQWLNTVGLRTEYAIERVIEHIAAPKQNRFPEN